MISLNVINVAKAFASEIFSDVNIHLSQNGKVGLIGDNGSGKSSFLKMLAGLESVTTGRIEWSRNAKIGYLNQEIVSDAFNVSGGENKILKLTELFYGDYNILLLDEPDNHLDLDHKKWFLELVLDFNGIVITISHDRRFLETAVDTIWHLEEKRIKSYPYNYKKFKEVYENSMDIRKKLYETQEKERLRLVEMVANLRIQATANDKFVGRYHSAEKRLEKWTDEMIEAPPVEKVIQLDTNVELMHKKKTALFLGDLTKSYGENSVLKNVNLHLYCGEKIAIAAPNGSGKSTLLNIIAGRLAHTIGTVRIGEGLTLGYYAQEHLDVLEETKTPVEELQKSTKIFHYDAIAYLKRFLFTEEQIQKEVRFLSGGQKSRLQLAKFLANNPNILVLDEPTNHLDLKTVLALEKFLKNYKGTLILVSHDEEFVKNCVENVVILKDGRLKLQKL